MLGWVSKALHVFLHLERLIRQWAVSEDEGVRKRESNIDFNAAIQQWLKRMPLMGFDHSLGTKRDGERRHILLLKPLFSRAPARYTSHWVLMVSTLYWLHYAGIYQELHCKRGSVWRQKEQEPQSAVKRPHLSFACY